MGVKVDPTLWAGGRAGEAAHIVLTEIAMPIDGDSPPIFVENRIPNSRDGLLRDAELDHGRGFKDDLVSVSLFLVCFEHFGADASDG